MKKFLENFLISLLAVEESEQNLCNICSSYENLQKENLELQKLYEETVVELEIEKVKNTDLAKANLWYTGYNKSLREARNKAEQSLWVTKNYALALIAVVIFKLILENFS